MNKSIKFIHHKLNKKEKEGYIYIQHIENRTKSYRSLGLPKIHEKYWDEGTQRVRKTKQIEYEIYNSKIEEKLKELLISDKDINTIEGIKTRRSFLSYFESIIEDKLKQDHGTRLKYKTVLNKLKDYVKSKNRTDLSFSELDLDLIEDLNSYLKSTGLEINSVIHYLKVIRVIIRKSQKRKEYINVKDPFVNYKFENKQKKTKETLTKEDILKIKDFNIPDVKLDRVRNLFMFQFFTNGLRVSDLVTLRFNNLKNGRIQFNMFKTNNEINIPILDTHIELFVKLLNLKTNINDITIDDKKKFRFRFEELKKGKTKSVKPQRPSPIRRDPPSYPRPLLLDIQRVEYHRVYDEYSDILTSMNLEEITDEYLKIIEFNKSKGRIQISGSMTVDLTKDFERLDGLIKGYIKLLEKLIVDLRVKYRESVISELNTLGTDKRTRNHFVFDLLKNEDFTDIDEKNNFNLIDFSQYQKIHKSGVLYNKYLKDLQKVVGLTMSLRTHLPRISFTNIMLGMEGINHLDISKKLGHSSISITDKYVETGFNSVRQDKVQRRIDGILNSD